MGNWNINIQGVGCHHNSNPKIDADLAAVEFVAKLREMGLVVESASFTSGSALDLIAHSGPQNQLVSVSINGKAREKFPSTASYESVALAAGFALWERPSMTYARARFGKEGILQPGQKIEAVDGTRFSVANTGNA